MSGGNADMFLGFLHGQVAERIGCGLPIDQECRTLPGWSHAGFFVLPIMTRRRTFSRWIAARRSIWADPVGWTRTSDLADPEASSSAFRAIIAAEMR